MTRVALIGSRDYRDMDRVAKYVRSLPSGTELVLASTPGVSDVAKLHGKAIGFTIHTYWPRIDLFGSKAALMRGRLMVEESDRLVVFSTGSWMTEETMMYAAKKGREVICFPDSPMEEVAR